ncbi:efflux transporter outer membrane subunit [Methylovirgula sp. HY1]|uniref:efflux transporter outer membrane subunit n=1 Tax=Methylovirgula sp. HY1 TaxID=2822761 RepID=UPI001C753B5F|nr:efflux transporter outer membrane subunit [Methylovirgula sp. HY1]QXX73405.1 Toluene efflux pump outer membrane protein TtgF [Methylovirgula sp. HY1]
MGVLLAGCAVGPNFVPPDPGLPQTSFLTASTREPTQKNATRSTLLAPPNPDWWSIFHDRRLTSLEQRVAESNLDVKKATLRLAQSRFNRNVAASAQLPSLSGNTSYEREGISQNGLLGLFSGTPGQEASGGFGSGVGGVPGSLLQPFSLWQYGFDASWELDLWGKVRRQVESADAQVQASVEQSRGVLISSLAEVARDYMQLRGVQMQIKIAKDNLATARQILDVSRTRAQRGLTTGLDVEDAAAQVEAVRAQLPDLERQESEQINALSLLLGEAPGTLAGELVTPHPVPPSPPRLPLGIPSELARRRPDIRQAEAQLHAATADIGVAVGDFYPSVALNGSVGFQALDLKNLWKGTSLQYAMGPSVTLPIFEGGKLKATLAMRTAQQREAAITYHETVLKAWHDVVNALVAYRTERERHLRLIAQAGHARAALGLARDRYDNGVAQFITVLDAERTLLQAEQQAATSATTVAIDLVALYKALGGGWESTFPAAPEPRVNLLKAALSP